MTTPQGYILTRDLPTIPAKRYFTIGEVGELCGVKPHVLRYWEQEFTQLKPVKRRGNRRYYQHHEVLLIRRIRELLYEQGFTISGARNRLRELVTGHGRAVEQQPVLVLPALSPQGKELEQSPLLAAMLEQGCSEPAGAMGMEEVKEELLQIRALLSL